MSPVTDAMTISKPSLIRTGVENIGVSKPENFHSTSNDEADRQNTAPYYQSFIRNL